MYFKLIIFLFITTNVFAFNTFNYKTKKKNFNCLWSEKLFYALIKQRYGGEKSLMELRAKVILDTPK